MVSPGGRSYVELVRLPHPIPLLHRHDGPKRVSLLAVETYDDAASDAYESLGARPPALRLVPPLLADAPAASPLAAAS